jgi:hypothetical protein
MFSKVYKLRASVPIPISIPPETVVQALQKPENLLDLGSLLHTYEQIPTDWLPERIHNDNTYFSAFDDGPPITAYEVTDIIPIIPGAGSWATKHIKFFARFQNLPDGVRSYVNASAGVTVKSEYRVIFKERRATANADNDNGEEESIENGWRLVEFSSVECFALMMPFVASNLDVSHKDMLQQLLTKIEAAQGQPNGSGGMPS